MTEAEWLETRNPGVLLEPRLPVDPDQMLRYVADEYAKKRKRGRGDRKLRLFAIASCRQHWTVLSEAGQEAVLRAEELADGRLPRSEMEAYRRSARIPHWGSDYGNPDHLARAVIDTNALVAAYHAGNISRNLNRPIPDDLVCYFESAAIVREIFGNPFKPIVFGRSWRTTTASAIARQIYDSRDFSAMPILADALQDAGCDNADILDHCRGPGPHVRGCWVVDLVLGKE
jgi:hypothetical protein